MRHNLKDFTLYGFKNCFNAGWYDIMRKFNEEIIET